MITGQLIGVEKVAERFDKARNGIIPAMETQMYRIVARLNADVVKNKLSGQALKVRTGTLRRSITQQVRSDTAGVTGIVGTNVEYAAIHEYGFNGMVNVKEHLRRTKAQMSLKGIKSRGAQGAITVKAHSRHVNFPERSFLRSAMEENRQEIMQEMSRSVAEVLK